MRLVYPERSDAVVSEAKGLSSIGPYSQLATGPMPTRVRWDIGNVANSMEFAMTESKIPESAKVAVEESFSKTPKMIIFVLDTVRWMNVNVSGQVEPESTYPFGMSQLSGWPN